MTACTETAHHKTGGKRDSLRDGIYIRVTDTYVLSILGTTVDISLSKITINLPGNAVSPLLIESSSSSSTFFLSMRKVFLIIYLSVSFLYYKSLLIYGVLTGNDFGYCEIHIMIHSYVQKMVELPVKLISLK